MCDCITKEIFRTIGSGVSFVVSSVVHPNPDGSASFCRIRICRYPFQPKCKVRKYKFGVQNTENYDTYNTDERDQTV
jgi:hypothetical protein